MVTSPAVGSDQAARLVALAEEVSELADQLRTEIATLYPDGVPVSAAEGVSRLHRVPPPVRVGRVGPTRASGERTLGTLGKDRPGRAV